MVVVTPASGDEFTAGLLLAGEEETVEEFGALVCVPPFELSWDDAVSLGVAVVVVAGVDLPDAGDEAGAVEPPAAVDPAAAAVVAWVLADDDLVQSVVGASAGPTVFFAVPAELGLLLGWAVAVVTSGLGLGLVLGVRLSLGVTVALGLTLPEVLLAAGLVPALLPLALPETAGLVATVVCARALVAPDELDLAAADECAPTGPQEAVPLTIAPGLASKPPPPVGT